MTLPGISLPDDRYRRFAGFTLGALVGAVYAAVVQFGDRIAIPGAPLYQPPVGAAGNVVLFALGGGLLGLITAWPRSALAGTFIAAAVSAAVIVGSAYLSAGPSARENPAASVVGFIFVALPFWGLLVPVLGALRWVVGHEEEARRDRQPWHRRVLQPLVLLLVVGLVGLTGLYPNDARILITRTNAILKTAQERGATPEFLAATDFGTRGQGPYELSWESQRLERYRIPRPGRNFDRHSAVVARFENGWNLVCIYITLTEPPLCQGMEELPR